MIYQINDTEKYRENVSRTKNNFKPEKNVCGLCWFVPTIDKQNLYQKKHDLKIDRRKANKENLVLKFKLVTGCQNGAIQIKNHFIFP